MNVVFVEQVSCECTRTSWCDSTSFISLSSWRDCQRLFLDRNCLTTSAIFACPLTNKDSLRCWQLDEIANVDWQLVAHHSGLPHHACHVSCAWSNRLSVRVCVSVSDILLMSMRSNYWQTTSSLVSDSLDSNIYKWQHQNLRTCRSSSAGITVLSS